MKSTSRFLVFGLALLCSLLTYTAFSQNAECPGIESGNISFNPSSCTILPAAQLALERLADQMKFAPACRVIVMGNAGGNKFTQELSWERVQSVIEKMSESYNIDRNRFVFSYDGAAGIDRVEFRVASPGEDGPSTVPAPHPDLSVCK